MDCIETEDATNSSDLDFSGQIDLKCPQKVLLSPLGISRYGRTRKPKISQDFCNIDDAFESNNANRNNIHRRCYSRSPIKSPRKFKYNISRSNENLSSKDEIKAKLSEVSRFPKILHVTGDCISYESDVEEHNIMEDALPIKSPDNSFKIRKFFKSNIEGTKLQTMTKMYINKNNQVYAPNKNNVKSENTCNPSDEKLFEDSTIDVSKVFKIISNKSNVLPETKVYPKQVLKTYSNKRKFPNKPIIIESFALPDDPIVPLSDEIYMNPFRISEIDADVPEARNVNLMDTEIKTADNDMLLNINMVNLFQGTDVRQSPIRNITKMKNELHDVKDEKFDCDSDKNKAESCNEGETKDTLHSDLNEQKPENKNNYETIEESAVNEDICEKLVELKSEETADERNKEIPCVKIDEIVDVKEEEIVNGGNDEMECIKTKGNVEVKDEVTEDVNVISGEKSKEIIEVKNEETEDVEIEETVVVKNHEVINVSNKKSDGTTNRQEKECEFLNKGNKKNSFDSGCNKKIENASFTIEKLNKSSSSVDKLNNVVTVNINKLELACNDLQKQSVRSLKENLVLIKMVNPVYKHINNLRKGTKSFMKRPFLTPRILSVKLSSAQQTNLNNHVHIKSISKSHSSQEEVKQEEDSLPLLKKEITTLHTVIENDSVKNIETKVSGARTEATSDKKESDCKIAIETEKKFKRTRLKTSVSSKPEHLLHSSQEEVLQEEDSLPVLKKEITAIHSVIENDSVRNIEAKVSGAETEAVPDKNESETAKKSKRTRLKTSVSPTKHLLHSTQEEVMQVEDLLPVLKKEVTTVHSVVKKYSVRNIESKASAASNKNESDCKAELKIEKKSKRTKLNTSVSPQPKRLLRSFLAKNDNCPILENQANIPNKGDNKHAANIQIKDNEKLEVAAANSTKNDSPQKNTKLNKELLIDFKLESITKKSTKCNSTQKIGKSLKKESLMDGKVVTSVAKNSVKDNSPEKNVKSLKKEAKMNVKVVDAAAKNFVKNNSPQKIIKSLKRECRVDVNSEVKENNGSPQKLKSLKKELVIKVKNSSPQKNVLSLKRDAVMDEKIEQNVQSPGRSKKNSLLISDIPEHNLGDLVWAKVGSYPYWPCVVSKEPTSAIFKKSQMRKMIVYHVRFFGDNGRRSWVPVRNLLPYKLYDRNKPQAEVVNVIVPPRSESKYKNWRVAIREADSLVNKSVKERFEFFFDMFASKGEKQIKKLQNEQKLHSSLMENKARSSVSPKKMRSSLPANLGNEKNKTKVKEKSKNIESSNEEPTQKRVTRSSVLSLNNDKKNSKYQEILPKELLEIRLTQPTPQREILGSEYSLSDTDSNSKLSIVNSPLPFTLESQEVLHKRNNLFKGISRERVCQICEKTGNVIKCKGRCSGYYHINCAREIKRPDATQDLKPGSSSNKEVEVKLDLQEIQINSSENKRSADWTEFKNMNDVQIVQIKERRKINTPPKLLLNTDPHFKKLPLFDQIDHKMEEVMKNVGDKTLYADSTTDYTSSEESLSEDKSKQGSNNATAKTPVQKARMVKQKMDCSKNNESPKTSNFNKSCDYHLNDVDFKCNDCLADADPVCFVCCKELSKKNSSIRQKCSIFPCGKFYHPECLKMWPQTQWSLIATTQHKKSNKMLDTFVCPVHVCHTCVSDDPRTAISRCISAKVVKCLRCPATYHTSSYCVPAGTEILSSTQIICPRHLTPVGKKHRRSHMLTINTTWCFLCSQGGDLICCETCPTSVHLDCLKINLQDDDTFICEDCETGRFPLYDEIVWVKLGTYRWWPAVILFPNEVPENVRNISHNKGEFVVKFFGTHDHYWSGRGRVFLFQEGDTGGHTISIKKKVDEVFLRSIEEAREAHRLRKEFKITREAEIKNGLKPPPFIKIKVNRPVGNVRQFDGNISNTTPCECNPKQSNPCGPDSDCLNRLLMTECDPEVCPAGAKCQNQNFEKRKYPPLVPYRTEGRGWGLKSPETIKKGQFVIEYVGELIDEREYQRRIKKMHEQKEENYYFLTIDKDRMIDAGPKGNVARFMNHSCQPNCETQKWTVNGDTRVGLFATVDIPANTELTFNYNLECIGKERKICRCGAPNCSGFIGVKAKLDESQKKPKKTYKRLKKKKEVSIPEVTVINNDPCFVCGKTGNVGTCHNKICTKFYHLECVNLNSWPENKWVCPWHNCNLCSKRTIRCCVKCVSSYCPVHSEGNIRYDKLLGFICSEHDPNKESHEIQAQSTTKRETHTIKETSESDVTSTTCDDVEEAVRKNIIENRKILNASPIVQAPKKLINNSTSTPVKGDKSSFLEEFQAFVNENKIHKETELKDLKRKRGRPRTRTVESNKRRKLDNKNYEITTSVIKPKNPSPNLINSVQNEVILSSTVPSRHLRASKVTNDVEENGKFLKRRREYEKALPIRKRSALRCETST